MNEAIIISVDTLNPEHLISRFIDYLHVRIDDLSLERGAPFKDTYAAVTADLSEIEHEAFNNPAYYDSESSMFDLEILQDWLQELTPEDMYFGYHDGDGACIGYWPVDEDTP